MNKIKELLKKIRVVANQDDGQAHWEAQDLLGDRHCAVISWSENFLKVEKSVEVNGFLESLFVTHWEISEKGRLLLKECSGLPPQLGSSEAFEHVRQSLESGVAPTVVSATTSKGFSP